MRRVGRPASLALLTVGLIACGVQGAALTPWQEPTQVVAADFDQACEVAEDCLPVIEQGNCGQCGYPAAITAEEQEDWEELRERRARNCTQTLFIECPELQHTAACEEQRCVAVEAP